jgi:hypothetical protein
MGARIVGFILYLAMSYGVIYVLISERFLRERNIKVPQPKAAVAVAIILIIGVGTMLVGPLPMVLMVIAIFAFIDYVRSSESLATAGDRTPSWRMPPGLIGAIDSLRRRLTDASTYHGVVRILQPVLPVARRVLAVGVERMSGYFRSLTARVLAHRKSRELSAPGNDQGDTAQSPPGEAQPTPAKIDEVPPPPLSLAEGHGLFAVRLALTPTKPVERMPTREEAQRLLDRLEGRA